MSALPSNSGPSSCGWAAVSSRTVPLVRVGQPALQAALLLVLGDVQVGHAGLLGRPRRVRDPPVLDADYRSRLVSSGSRSVTPRASSHSISGTATRRLVPHADRARLSVNGAGTPVSRVRACSSTPGAR